MEDLYLRSTIVVTRRSYTKSLIDEWGASIAILQPRVQWRLFFLYSPIQAQRH